MKLPEEESSVVQETSEFNVIFIHSKLDDAGLTAGEFRVYAHLSRRASGGGKAWPSIRSIADACRMNKDTVSAAIRTLEARNMLHRQERGFTSTVYKLTPPSVWLVSETEGQEQLSENRGQAVRNRGTVPVRKEGTEGNPVEGNPLKSVHREGDFDEFWSWYPKREAKAKARTAFKTARASKVLTEIREHVLRMSQTEEWRKEKGRYIPLPTTYLNQRRWEDEGVRLPLISNGTKPGYIEV